MSSIIQLLDLTRSDNPTLKDERLLFNVNIDNKPITTLYDTGAQDSVWCDSLDELLYYFPKAYPTHSSSIIAGFGGVGVERSEVYIIPELHVGELVLLELPVVIKRMSFPISLVLQCNVFKMIDYVVSMRKSIIVLPDSKPVRFRPFISNERKYLGSYVFLEEGSSESNLPADLLEYSKSSGKSVDAIAQEIFNCMPESMKDSNLSVLENALLEWDTFKKFL